GNCEWHYLFLVYFAEILSPLDELIDVGTCILVFSHVFGTSDLKILQKVGTLSVFMSASQFPWAKMFKESVIYHITRYCFGIYLCICNCCLYQLIKIIQFSYRATIRK
ncbi:hypothetical protein ACJX0J_021455, partial [Zea mays]